MSDENADDATADEVFFREWENRRPGERRSLTRARALADALGLAPSRPVLTVVGSKGKGTAATFASAVLSAAGLRVCTVTSPALRGNRDRVRVDGRSISATGLAALADRLRRAVDALPPPTDGYLSPSGLFILAGVLHARDTADVIVLEAGMGGRSDEVSLFPPTVAAITPIFREHIGVLGDTVAEIAREKLGVVTSETRAVLSAPQTPTVEDAFAGPTPIDVVESSGVPAELLPPGLGRASAELGIAAARRLLELEDVPACPPERLHAVLSSISLPGRLSWHRVPGTSTQVLADSAIDRVGIAAALSTAMTRWGRVDHAVVCLPDHKDLEGAVTELGDVPVTYVRLPQTHLRFTHPLPSHWRTVDSANLTPESLAALGDHVVALGTVYFVAEVLDLVDADTSRLFTPPAP
ncbi:folylpolyglutamate synthase/dihydrofolate synthase family protein [Actinomadura algeriensis]|uniref:Dihydrofolate synthase/folylpolyglutamate synthase n=1 Tax=Actinomadura algeriensis TaxID=1679523 RepID=A0ABR9JRH1_9ACTN|nr:hypothetical protein [Actinomadura algeriensis]MBE1533167.1 dihydrofolate synthase/folylpolyglutamate synthase [Actinomadura algeriensis]